MTIDTCAEMAHGNSAGLLTQLCALWGYTFNEPPAIDDGAESTTTSTAIVAAGTSASESHGVSSAEVRPAGWSPAKPIIAALAATDREWSNPATRANLEILQRR